MRFIQDLIELIKLTKKERLEKTIRSLECVNENLVPILDELLSQKDFSIYRLELLSRKVCLLQGIQAKAEADYKAYESNLEFLDKKASLLSIALYLIGFALIPFIGLTAPLMIILVKNIIEIRIALLQKNFIPTKESVEKIIRDANNTTTSCQNFIYKKFGDYEKLNVEENACQIEFTANEFIANYLDNEEVVCDNQEVMLSVIKILQFELQTDEKDFKILLEQARERVSEESINSEFKLERTKE